MDLVCVEALRRVPGRVWGGGGQSVVSRFAEFTLRRDWGGCEGMGGLRVVGWQTQTAGRHATTPAEGPYSTPPRPHLKSGIWSSGMPLCLRICHCVAPVPFLAAALLFLPLNLVGSAFTSAAWAASGAAASCGAGGGAGRHRQAAIKRTPVAVNQPFDRSRRWAGRRP